MNSQTVPVQVPAFNKGWSFFLDVDGTLIDFAPQPDQVTVSKKLVGVLEHLRMHTNGAVALISGRPIQDLDQLFKPVRFAMAGQHGLERRDNYGVKHLHPMPDGDFTLVKTSIKEFASKRKNLFIIVACGNNQNVVYERTYIGYTYTMLKPGQIGTALAIAPYIVLARNAVPKNRFSDLQQMTLSQWK